MIKVLLTCLLIVIAVIDARTYRIPDYLSLAVAILGLFSFRGQDAIIGAVAVSGLILVLALRKGNSSIGGGDIKLIAALGFVLGFWGVMWSVTIALIAFLVVYALFYRKPEKAYALAPYLAFGSIIVIWRQQ